MQKCYHPKIQFSDPVFPNLNPKEANAMWHMLLSVATDLTITFTDIATNNNNGSCHWEAHYSFSRTGRRVHNKIDANFDFKDGLIIRHQDEFDVWKWSRMALGISGLVLGWTPFMRGKIQSMARQNLKKFIEKNPEYQ